MASLEIKILEEPSRTERIEGDRVVIGRGPDTTLQLVIPQISRHHCELTVQADGSWILRDLDSHNGTFHEGQRISELSLSHGTRFQIAQRAVIIFHETSEVPASGSKSDDDSIKFASDNDVADRAQPGPLLSALNEETGESEDAPPEVPESEPGPTPEPFESADDFSDDLDEKLRSLAHAVDEIRPSDGQTDEIVGDPNVSYSLAESQDTDVDYELVAAIEADLVKPIQDSEAANSSQSAAGPAKPPSLASLMPAGSGLDAIAPDDDEARFLLTDMLVPLIIAFVSVLAVLIGSATGSIIDFWDEEPIGIVRAAAYLVFFTVFTTVLLSITMLIAGKIADIEYGPIPSAILKTLSISVAVSAAGVLITIPFVDLAAQGLVLLILLIWLFSLDGFEVGVIFCVGMIVIYVGNILQMVALRSILGM